MEDHVKKEWRDKVRGGYPSWIGRISVKQVPGNLGDLPGISNDKDDLQARTKRIRIQKYLREKLLPPH